jgi:S1-C subfamily serine protease
VWLLDLDDQITDWLAVLGFSGRGVRVVTLQPGQPARQAGLRPRDIITHVNDTPIDSRQQLGSKISTIMPGDVARVRVWRYDDQSGSGHVMTHNVQLNRLDEMTIMGTIPSDQHDIALRRLGLARIATNTPRLADESDLKFQPGVLVVAVVPGSKLDGVIEPGSVIVTVMERSVADEDEFFAVLERYDLSPEGGVQITYITPSGRRGTTHLSLE